MTVSELIAELSTMPQDAEVVYQAFSDWNILEAHQVRLSTAEEERAKAFIVHRDGARAWRPYVTVFRQGRFCDMSLDQFPPGEEPVFRTVVALPGN